MMLMLVLMLIVSMIAMLADVNTPKGGGVDNICQQHQVLMLMDVVSPPADNITVNNITPAVDRSGRVVGEAVVVVGPQRLAAGVVEPSADRQHLPYRADPL